MKLIAIYINLFFALFMFWFLEYNINLKQKEIDAHEKHVYNIGKTIKTLELQKVKLENIDSLLNDDSNINLELVKEILIKNKVDKSALTSNFINGFKYIFESRLEHQSSDCTDDYCFENFELGMNVETIDSCIFENKRFSIGSSQYFRITESYFEVKFIDKITGENYNLKFEPKDFRKHKYNKFFGVSFIPIEFENGLILTATIDEDNTKFFDTKLKVSYSVKIDLNLFKGNKYVDGIAVIVPLFLNEMKNIQIPKERLEFKYDLKDGDQNLN